MIEALVERNVGQGLHTESEVSLLPEGASATAENVIFERNTVQVRPGRARHAAVPTTDPVQTAGFRALAEYYDSADSLSASRIAGAIGTKVYATATTTQGYGTYATAFAAIHASNRIRMQQFGDELYCVDGSAAVKKWNPTDGERPLTDLISPTLVATITGAASNLKLGSLRDSEINGTESWWETSSMGGDHYWLNLSRFNPKLIDDTDCRGACVRKYTSAANVYTGETACVGLEMVKVSSPIGSTFNCTAYMVSPIRHRYSIYGKDTDVFGVDLSDATFIRVRYKIVAGAGKPHLYLQFDSDFNTTTPPDNLTYSIEIDTTGVSLNTWAEYDVDITGIAAANRTNVRWIAIKAVSVDTGDVTQATGRLEYTSSVYVYTDHPDAVTILIDSIAANISGSVFLADTDYEFYYTYVYTADESAGSPHGPTEGNGGGIYHTPSDIMLVPLGLTIHTTIDTLVDPPDYVYLYARGGTSSYYKRIGEYTVQALDTVHDFTWDGLYSQTAAISNEYISRPPLGCTMLTEWRGRMVYAGNVPGESGAKDALLISNLDDPDLVPTNVSSLMDVPLTYGGWARVGRDGKAVTGLGKLGSYLLAFKERGVWVVAGEVGQPDFTIPPISTVRGCVAHETICQVDGNMLVWLEDDSVWGWDGQEFHNIGKPISTLVKAHSTTVKRAAFAAYDPVRRWYVLTAPRTALTIAASPSGAVRTSNVVTITTSTAHGLAVGDTVVIEGCTSSFNGVFTIVSVPLTTTFTYAQTAANGTGGSGSVCGSISYVWHPWIADDGREYRGWTTFTGQPGGALLYAHHAATAGLYAGDLYGLAGAGYLYRLNTGTTDETSSNTALSIIWVRRGKAYSLPFTSRFKDIRKVVATVSLSEPLTTLTMGIRINGNTTDATSRACDVQDAPGQGAKSVWYPAPIADVACYQLGMSGTSSVGGEITRLEWYAQAQAKI